MTDTFLMEHMILAYAVSVHSTQGSEYTSVALACCAEYGNFLLRRKLLYTGLTRAAKRLYVVHEGKEFEKAAGRLEEPRKTTLGSLLRDSL